ncbi:kinase-like domain-containing protein [Truncatella angustata]|uniref:EKC/KEOPS complex subunit BUD32 n=1 Tax=Truncatella angustata TaxID=152316 RepID=A0A9P8UFE4_9PEZI|nr:kinase-like domain-containing protein [Truncatella angustata]KAH6648912.1 kinase-like domain-containing protein [Truncatella angustata]
MKSPYLGILHLLMLSTWKAALASSVGPFSDRWSTWNASMLALQPTRCQLYQISKFVSGKSLSKKLLQQTLQLVLLGLDLLHQAGVIHRDISPNNILLRVQDTSVFSEVEQNDIKRPIARKILSDRVIYLSHLLPITYGPPVICDFGAAKIGSRFHGNVMPGVYRAPEIIMGMEWDSKIDIGSVGVIIWDLFEGGRLFRTVKDGNLNNEQHLAEIVSLIGNPPRKFLEQSENCRQYWDADEREIGSALKAWQMIRIQKRWSKHQQ